MPLKSVALNVNSNEIKKDGAREIINSFRRMNNLTKLELFMRNIGLGKEDGKNFKTDLTQGKIGTPFETLDLYL